MALTHYLGTTEEMTAEIEKLLASIDAGATVLATEAEEELRDIFRTMMRTSRYRRLAGLLRVDFAHPETRKARREAMAAIDRWRDETLRRFGAELPESILLTRSVLPEMNLILDQVARDWTKMIRRITAKDKKGRPLFSPRQIAEAKELSRDTAFFRRRFGKSRKWLEEQGVEASFGKIENLGAMVRQTHRQARNVLVGMSFGAPRLRGGLVTSSLGRAVEASRTDFETAAETIGFNENVRRLSSTAHMRGLYNSAMIRTAQALGVSHFMYYLTQGNRARARGMSRAELYQVRLGEVEAGGIGVGSLANRTAATLGRPRAEIVAEARRRASRGEAGVATNPKAENVRRALARMIARAETISTWPEVYDRANAGRKSSAVWAGNLSIHPGSLEWYVPTFPTLLAEARSRARRRRLELSALEAA
jgi:hypothetical protein